MLIKISCIKLDQLLQTVSISRWNNTLFTILGLTLNLDISIDQFNAGLTLLFLASRNTSDGTSTASAVYIISFYYSGGNFPSIAYLGGTNNFVSFGSSGGKLTATNGSGGNAAYSWFTSR